MTLRHTLEGITAKRATLSTLKDRQATLVSDREAAVRKAALPFDTALRTVDGEIRAITAPSQETIHNRDIHPKVIAALELSASESGYKSLDALLADYSSIELQDFHRKRVEKAIAGVACFEALVESLQQGDTSFAAVLLDWSEMKDAQAEIEGRDARTGDYIRTGSVYIGLLGINDIFSRYSEKSGSKMTAIDLVVNRLRHFDTRLDWLYSPTTTESASADKVLTLFGKQGGNSISPRTTDWDMSNTATLAQPTFQYGVGYLPSGYRFEPIRSIVWGDQVNQLLENLHQDSHAPRTLAEALGTYAAHHFSD
ncbi:MAG: hypothetical protein WBP12_05335 [Candidatus Saccharimonas sp.]